MVGVGKNIIKKNCKKNKNNFFINPIEIETEAPVFRNTTKTTASSIPAWSPTAVLTGPFHAWLPRSDESGYFHERMAVAESIDLINYL